MFILRYFYEYKALWLGKMRKMSDLIFLVSIVISVSFMSEYLFLIYTYFVSSIFATNFLDLILIFFMCLRQKCTYDLINANPDDRWMISDLLLYSNLLIAKNKQQKFLKDNMCKTPSLLENHWPSIFAELQISTNVISFKLKTLDSNLDLVHECIDTLEVKVQEL